MLEKRSDGERHDVSSPADVEQIVRRFYGAVAQDDLLGPMFNDVAQVDWSEHLPKLTAFWCRALFGTAGYQGNPYAKHRVIHAQAPFTAEHFARWLELFEETVDDGWCGERAESMKALAHRVAEVHGRQLVGTPVDFGGPLEIIG
jgi:hemoglobin